MIILRPKDINDILDYFRAGYLWIDTSIEGIKFFRPRSGYQFAMPFNVPVIFKDEKDIKKICILFQNKELMVK